MLEQFDVLVGLVGTEDEPQGRLLAGASLVFFQPAEVQLHLPLVGCLELAELQVDRHQLAQAAVVEQQIEVIILIVHGDPLLPGDEGEITAQFQDKRLELAEDRLLHIILDVQAGQTEEVQEIRVAKDQVGGHAVLVPDRSQVLNN